MGFTILSGLVQMIRNELDINNLEIIINLCINCLKDDEIDKENKLDIFVIS